jgi:hypothetical protein
VERNDSEYCNGPESVDVRPVVLLTIA